AGPPPRRGVHDPGDLAQPGGRGAGRRSRARQRRRVPAGSARQDRRVPGQLRVVTRPGPRDGARTVHRRRRPGAGQATRRASRGWHPETIVSAYLLPDERVVREETRSVRGFLVAQAPWLVLIVLGVIVV